MRALLIFLSINVASVTSFLPRQGAFVWYKHQQPLSLALWSLKSSSQQQPYDVDGPLVAVSPTRTRSNGSRVPRLSKGSWGQLLAAIRLYHAIHGDLLVEDGWCVPREPPWPHQLWGKRLARLVYDMGFWQTHVAQFPARRADLEKLGFVWGRLQSEYNLVVEALLVLPSTAICWCLRILSCRQALSITTLILIPAPETIFMAIVATKLCRLPKSKPREVILSI